MSKRKDDLKARLMVEAEKAIDKMLNQEKAITEWTLKEMEGMVLSMREQISGETIQALTEDQTQHEILLCECPECGLAMHYKGRKGRRLVTEGGEIEIERAYYYCPDCKCGLFPPG